MTGRVLISGINGFLGSALAQTLASKQYRIAGTVRDRSRIPTALAASFDRIVSIGNMDEDCDWRPALVDVHTVIHAAAANSGRNISARDLTAVNVGSTAAFARQAAEAGVERFIFVSTIKVHGDTSGTIPFHECDPCRPNEPYAVSKLAAEKELQRIHAETGMQMVIVRPCLIYGPGVRGSFYRLMQAVDKHIPLPFGALKNRRSMIGLRNAATLLASCVSAPLDAFSIFLAADPEPLSTPDWIREISIALEQRPRLVRLSPRFLSAAARRFGFSAIHEKLCLSLEVDAAHVQKQTGWIPVQSRAQAMRETAAWYRTLRQGAHPCVS